VGDLTAHPGDERFTAPVGFRRISTVRGLRRVVPVEDAIPEESHLLAEARDVPLLDGELTDVTGDASDVEQLAGAKPEVAEVTPENAESDVGHPADIDAADAVSAVDGSAGGGNHARADDLRLCRAKGLESTYGGVWVADPTTQDDITIG